jgi:hypothetical protein
LFLLLITSKISFGQCDSLITSRKFEVRIIEGSVESSEVVPRTLTCEELQMIEESSANHVVIIQLDLYTEVKIYPKSSKHEK